VKLGNFSLAKAIFFVAVSFLCANVVAQSINRQVGTQFTVTADPRVQRPHTPSCITQLFSNFQFALFSETTQTFSFTPPANCVGPYDKVVLDVDFSENAGVQFDRTASIYLGNANIYFGTTPEPLSNATNTWHIERDITDYSALLAAPQQGTMVLQNCTGQDCGAAFSFLNGVFTVNAKLEFFPAPGHSPAPRTADVVLPVVQSNGSGGVNLPIFLTLPPNSVSTTFNLPTNIERAYLDVVSQSQQTDEQWYACFPNDLSSINDLFGCGNTDFRETEISIDGVPAGIAPVSPWVFTGFLPDQWTPIPGAQTLDFAPYRVNLTPFAGMLSNGQPHTVTLSVFDQNFFFAESASLLLFLDHGAAQVTGEVTQNTLSAASPLVTENLQGTSNVTGNIGVAQNRNFTIEGFVNTSHGKVSTSVSQQQNFSSNQGIDFDVVGFTVLNQNISLQNNVNTLTKVSSRDGELVSSETFSFPINVDVAFPVSNSAFGFTVATTQNYHTSKLVLRNGNVEDFSSATNTVTASDVLPPSSSQHYTALDMRAPAYDCEIATNNNVLTSVSKGCKH
jgi:Peptide N-acetyl-beta-D-glucosaminyl asparaginase amidase A